MSAETYRYSGEKDGWKGSTMTVSSDGYYSYYGPVTGAHQFKIGTSANQWAYNHSYVSKGFNSTDITDLGDYGGDNAYCWSSKKHYILVYHPSTKINSSSKVKICASTFLPDDSESDLPEPEPEPAELTYNVTVPAGTKVCYINGDMTGWKFTEMTKVDDTHYTITIEGAKKDDGYKYASGSDWGYVEKDANGNEIGNRTYADGNDVVARWASVYDPDAVEQELTYNVTVPAGTYACYIAMDSDPAKDGWEFTAMTKVDETHYTFTRTGLKNKTYKYASGPSWDYVEKTSENGDVADRQWAENDVVAKWQAVYDPTPIYTVNVTAENGTVTGAGKHKEGATATLTATAAEGYEFVNWTVGEEVVSTENPYKFTVTADVALVANFELIPPTKYNVTVTAENGTVEGAGEYEEGTTATLTATPAEGYQFVNWTVGEEVVSTENPYSFVVTANIALVANFELIPPTKYNVTVTAENGTVEGAGEYEEGTTATLTATPAEGYQFVNWTVGEEVVSTENPYSFVVTANIALVANFELIPVVEPEKPEPTYTENNLNPYAFGLESKLSADKETLTVTYRLNNSNATSVNVVIYNGEEVVATVVGTTTIGKNTVEVPTADLPGGVELKWAVEVNGTSVAAPTQETKIYSIYHPSSVDIDNNPENPTFGMLLVNEAMHSVKTTTKETPYISKGFGAGIFAFTPSFDLMPNGELPGYNGGKTFSTATNMFAPRRIRFSKDGRIFVTAQDGSGEYLWEINPENLNEWTTVFQGTNDGYTLKDAEGNFIAGTNSGFDVRGEGENLQLLMLSASLPGAQVGSFKCHTYDLGTATTWATAPTKEIPGANYMLVTNQSNVQFDKDGGVWYISYRGTATEKEPGLVHINKDGVEDYKELRHMTRNAGFRFNHDFTKVIIAGNNGASKKATIYAISEDANGAPVLTQETVIDMSAVGANLNDFAWDYAGNLYACGNSSEKLAAWAMPYSGKVETPAASKYAFQLEGEPEVQYEVYEDEITNLVFDLESMTCYGGPSENFQAHVFLVLGEDNGDGTFALTDESSISVQGSDATFIEGYLANIDVYAPKADAVIRCDWNGMKLELHLAMSAAPIEATVVVVENAVVEVEKFEIFEGMYEHSLKMTGVWTDAEGLDYSVLVEIPVYYPEATEPTEVMSTVTVGSWDEGANWLGFGEGYLTITTVGDVVTATGVVENPSFGIAIDITISGSLSQGPGTALENATVVIKSIKKIQNGQLIIEKGGVQYNAQGAIVK